MCAFFRTQRTRKILSTFFFKLENLTKKNVKLNFESKTETQKKTGRFSVNFYWELINESDIIILRLFENIFFWK